jgi:hypothetical protein
MTARIAITRAKPRRSSERCGVRTAEKISGVGPSSPALANVMALSIEEPPPKQEARTLPL